MQPHVDAYLPVLRAAQRKLWLAYESEIDAQLKAKHESKAAELRKERTNRLNIHVLAKWRHFENGGAGDVIALLSNSHIGSADAKNSWSYASGQLILRWPNPQAPSGAWIDTVRVSQDGTTYSGSNQTRTAKITGIQVKDD